MPVDTQHPDYAAKLPDWILIGDVLEGSRAIKAKGVEYLPRLGDQGDEEYEAFKKRAQFVGVTAKAAESMTGHLFRRNPEMKMPQAAELAAIAADLTLSGINLHDYTYNAAEAVMKKGRAGTLIDFDEQEARPFALPYSAEAIINWKTKRVSGATVLSMVVLHEKDPEWIPLSEGETPKNPADEFEHRTYDQWRVLELKDDGQGGAFVQCTVWRRKDKKENQTSGEWVLIKDLIPTRRGIALSRIPFVFHNAADCGPDLGRVPLLEMAEVNISHYQTSADLENGRHICGIPTPWAAGFEIPKDGKLVLGANVAWVSDRPDAKAGFLEFQGQGLEALVTAMNSKESQMAALGAKMLQPEAKKAEAFDTVEMRNTAETSFLAKIARAISAGMSDVLQWCAWWIGTADDPEDLQDTISVKLNDDFLTSKMKPDELQQLVAAWMAGALDMETLFFNLQRGEIVEHTRTLEEMRGSIEANPPMPEEKEPVPASK